ncbi:MAG: aspartate aminotransferase family protein [bacterium]|nr:aspartate aminotransferase family protein [bacterium]
MGSLEERPVGQPVDLDELRSRLSIELGNEGVEAERVIDELVAATEGAHLGSAGGRFFAWVVGGALPAALAADWLAAAWDQNAALYASGPAAAVVEEVAGSWLKALFGLPPEASFAFTTGCQMAHFTGLAAARHAVLRRVGWDVNELGLFGAPPIRVLTSSERHPSVDRTLRYLGLGNKDIVPLRTNDEGCVAAAALEEELVPTGIPTIVVLDAADLNIAAFDPFAELIPIARKAGAWVHVDGAFGLFARASEAKARHLRGVEMADSWAVDAHKWLNVPYDCGIAFVRDSDAHRAAMSVEASYLVATKTARDQMDWNPEWSRRARGFAVYAALRELGRDGLQALVDRTCEQARALVDGMGALEGAEVLWRPRLNQGLIRFLDPRPGAKPSDHDARTDAVIEAINVTGEAFVGGTTWRGMRAMRISVVNWQTTDRDVERSIAAVARVLGSSASRLR